MRISGTYFLMDNITGNYNLKRKQQSAHECAKTYKNEGFCLAKSVLEEDLCDKIKDFLSTAPGTLNIPFSKIPWGYGNLIDVSPFTKIQKNKFILQFCENLLGKDYEYNHLMVANKAPWIGSEVEWHQETFNFKTYAPGWDPEKDWENLLQIYIAIDHQNLENGCLKVIPGSHNEGVLEHEDIINDKLGHKRRVPYEIMNKIYKKYGIKNIIMNPGDVLFFNHRLVHGSASNKSPYHRKSIVAQVRKILKKDKKVLEQEVEYRKRFVIEHLQKEIVKLTGKTLYNDFDAKQKNKN